MSRWFQVATILVLLLGKPPVLSADTHRLFLPLVISYKPPPPDYYIAFVSDMDGSQDIYSMRADGSNLRQVTNDDAYETFPAWSPDATRIVYTVYTEGSAEADLHIVDACGGVPEPLTDGDIVEGSSDWSPDGSTIAYSAYSAGAISIFLIGADGSNKRRLTPNSVNINSPRWSPDGQWIVARTSNDILAISADGQYVAVLASSRYSLTSPVWAQDWSRVAYVENDWTSHTNCIYTVDLDTLAQEPIHCEQDIIDTLDWSPDGTRILYSLHTLSERDLFLKDVEGPGLVQVNDAGFDADLGRFSPIKLP